MAAVPQVFDETHYAKFKADLESYLLEKEEEVRERTRARRPASGPGAGADEGAEQEQAADDPFFLSC